MAEDKISALQKQVNALQKQVNALSKSKSTFKIRIKLDYATQCEKEINETLKSRQFTITSFEVSNNDLILNATVFNNMYSNISFSDYYGQNCEFTKSCDNIVINRKYCFSSSLCILFARILATDEPWYIEQ
jgi:hypothetical protein